MLHFCVAHQQRKTAHGEGASERAEARASLRALSGMLKELMVKHDVECIDLRATDGKYVQMRPPAERRRPVRTEEEVVELVRGVGGAIADCAWDEVPRRVAVYATETMRDAVVERADLEPRICVVSRPVRCRTVDAASVASEVRRVAEQYVHNCAAKKRMLDDLRPLRTEERRAERLALDLVTDPVPVRMQRDGKSVDMVVKRCEHRGDARPRPMGVRVVASLCETAARAVCARLGRDGDPRAFETELRIELAEAARRHVRETQQSTIPRHYLKICRATGRRDVRTSSASASAPRPTRADCDRTDASAT